MEYANLNWLQKYCKPKVELKNFHLPRLLTRWRFVLFSTVGNHLNFRVLNVIPLTEFRNLNTYCHFSRMHSIYLQEEQTWSNKTTLNYQNEMEKREIVLIDKDLPIIKCLNSEAWTGNIYLMKFIVKKVTVKCRKLGSKASLAGIRALDSWLFYCSHLHEMISILPAAAVILLTHASPISLKP